MSESLTNFFNALIATSVPLYAYYGIFGLDFSLSLPIIVAVTLLNSYILSFAYTNTTSAIAQKHKTLEAAEVTARAVIFINTVFFVFFILFAFYFFGNSTAATNYVGSVSFAAAIASFSSSFSF